MASNLRSLVLRDGRILQKTVRLRVRRKFRTLIQDGQSVLFTAISINCPTPFWSKTWNGSTDKIFCPSKREGMTQYHHVSSQMSFGLSR